MMTNDALLHKVYSVVFLKLNFNPSLVYQIDIFGCLQSHLITVIWKAAAECAWAVFSIRCSGRLCVRSAVEKDWLLTLFSWCQTQCNLTATISEHKRIKLLFSTPSTTTRLLHHITSVCSSFSDISSGGRSPQDIYLCSSVSADHVAKYYLLYCQWWSSPVVPVVILQDFTILCTISKKQ